MNNFFYRRCSGLRLVLPFFLMFFLYCMIEVVELLSPFTGHGDLLGYYEISASYVLFGAPLFLVLAFVRYEVSFPEEFVVRILRIGDGVLLLSFVGLCFLAFDRIFIQGVDYSEGVSAARESWREIAVSRGGVSSVFSVFGNLMYPMVFIGFLIYLVFYGFYSKVALKLVLCFLIVFGFSILIGGRTSILVFLCLILGAGVIRFALGFSLLPRQLIGWSLFLFLFGFLFSALIFYWRMRGSSVFFDDYAMSLASRHNAYFVGDVGDVSIFNALLYSIAVYFVHVKWTFQAVLSDASLYGVSFLNQVFWILSSRAGLDFGVDFDWTYSGRWISLPGSVWHDYGFFGVCFVSLFMYLFLSVFMLGFVCFKNIPVDLKIVLVLLSGVFFTFFIMAPFSSMFEVVEFVYFSFSSLAVSSWYMSKGIVRRFLT